jgi:hypothetical protein
VVDGSQFELVMAVHRGSRIAGCCIAGLVLGTLSLGAAGAEERVGTSTLLPSDTAATISQVPVRVAGANNRVTVRVAPMDPSRLRPTDFADWDRDDPR